ncbi:ABC transporter permease [Enemella sp. A6]|uniref:ABC transporter permease n=1 Tax=Enemella sp. A6 TaxID=3440152 RepID=UPI003EBC2DA9
MTTIASTRAPRATFGTVLAAQFRNETRLLLREPATMIFGALLPLLAVVVMSAIPGARQPLDQMGGFSVVQSYVPILCLFSGSILGLTVMPAILGGYREIGVLRRLRTTPASPVTLLLALFLLVTIVAVLVNLIIVVIPALFGAGIPEHPALFAVTTFGAILAFVAMGTALAAVVGNSKVASGVGNVIAAVMWGAAGMWFPRAQFPDWLLTVADLTPGGAAAEAMLGATQGAAVGWQPFVVLLAWVIAGALLARATFRWE